MADKTWENTVISSTDSIMGTEAAEKFTVSKVTVTSGGQLGIYSAGGVDTISATNVTITGGQTNLEGGDQNDKMTVSGFYQSDGYLQVSGGWDNDSITIQNYTMTGGEASINADTGKDTLSVAKISVTGGDFSTGVNGNTNTFNVNGVTVTGGKFTAEAGYIERIGDRYPEDVVESLGGYNTITATNISQSGGEVYIFDRGKTKNNIAVSNLTVTGGQTSIAGTSSEGVDTISVKNVSVSGSYSNNGKVYISAAGDGDSVSLENISVSAYYGKVYVDGGGANNTISVKNSALAVSESYGEISIYGGTGGGNTSIQNVTIGGGDYYYGSLKAYSDGANTITADGVTLRSGYISLGSGGSAEITAQNISLKGGGVTLSGGTNAADKISLKNLSQEEQGGSVQIIGNGGNDSISAENVTLSYGANASIIGGSDALNIAVDNVSMYRGYFLISNSSVQSAGADTISVSNVTVQGYSTSTTYLEVQAGGGADVVSLTSSAALSSGGLKAGGGSGNDTIYVDNIDMTSGGSYTQVSVGGGEDNDLIIAKSITGGTFKVDGDAGADTISVENVSSVNINAGAGNDSVSITKLVENSSGHFYGGAGNDTIEFYETWIPYYNSYSGGGDVTGDEGNDLITARNATIYGTGFFGGEGNDTISVDNSTVTSGFRFYNGAGNDSISVSNITGNFSGDVMFYSEYSTYASDGNDTISLDNWTLTGDDSQRFLINGNFFTTDNSSINGADSISIKNIIAPNASFYVYGKGGNDTVSFENMTLGGLGTSYGSTNVRSGYIYGSFDSGNDSISFKNIEFYKGSSGRVSLNGGEGADTISVDDVTLGDENDGRYTQAHLSIIGGEGADVINVSNVSVTGSYSTASIDGGEGADKISVTDSDNLQITGGDGKDTLYLGGDVQGTISDYTAADDIISLSGGYNKAYYKDGVFIYGTGVKVSLKGVTDISSIGNGVIYNGSTKTNFNDFVTVLEWKLEDGVASYGDLITISGLSSLAAFSDLTIDGKAINTLDDEEIKELGGEIIVAKNALDSLKTVEITSGFTLALGEDVTDVPKDVPEHWEISEGNAAYFATGQSAGYVAYDNQIYYCSELKGGVITEINGLSEDATTEDISLENKIVTVKNHGLDANKTVTITNGYTLALGEDVETPITTPEGWQILEGTAEYKTENVTAGYTVKDNKIAYTPEQIANTVVAVTGLSSLAAADNLNLNKTTVTVSQNALDSLNTVEISDGYTLALGKDVEAAVTTPEGWQILKGTAEYKTENITAGYSVKDNKIAYTPEQIADTVVAVTGLKTSATSKQINLDKTSNKVSLASAAVQGTVTITDGYALEMGSGSYTKTTVQGGEGNDTIYSAGNKLAILGNGGADFISLKSGTSGNSINGGAGDDSIISEKGKNIYQYAEGDGNDTWQGFTANDSIQITSGEISSWKIEDDDLTLNVGEGAITIKDGAGIKINTAIGKNKNVAQIYTAEGILNDKQTAITLAADVESYTVPTKPAIVSIDGSATDGVSISGGSKAEKINGGAGADILNGGAGNDSLKGGDGADVFIYSAGNDVIEDYEAEDKISIGAEISSVGISSKDVTLKIGKGSVKIKDGVGKKVTVNDEVFIYEKGVTFNEEKTAATLTATVKAESLTSAVTVDASSMSAALKFSANDANNLINGGKGADSILGNAGDDTIYGNNGNDKLYGGEGADYLDGGAGNDSLSGGAGNNTLTGGAGNDVFIYEGGNDLITDYGTGNDSISLSTAITNAEVDGEDVIFTTADGEITLSGGAEKKIATVTKIGSKTTKATQIYSSLGTYNDKQTAITLAAGVESYTVPTKPAIVSIDGSATNGVEISGGSKAEKIFGGAGDDIINGDKGNDSIYGNAGNDSINGGEGNDKLFGDEGDDTLSGGAGNDTFTGGDGADVFVYSAGNDVIADYETEDKISLASGEIASVDVSGKDVTLKIGKGSIKLKNSVGIKVNVNDEVFIYEKGVTYNEEKTVATLTATVKAESLTSAVTVDGSALSAALKLSANDSSNLINGGKGADSILGNGGDDTIYGNNGADKIWGGDGNDYIDGGAGNDSIFGGAGENTLTGGDGNDVFIYEGGNDLITDYTAGKDKIKMDDEFTAAVNGQDVIFTTEKGKITVEGGAGVEITTLDSKNKATKQKYTSASAQTLDLLYDDNFVTDDFGIDDITAPKFEVQNIETQNNFELSQPVITYSEDK